MKKLCLLVLFGAFLVFSCDKDDPIDDDDNDDITIIDNDTMMVDNDTMMVDTTGIMDTIMVDTTGVMDTMMVDTTPIITNLPVITLIINNIEDIEGSMYIALYNSESAWDDDIGEGTQGNQYDSATPEVTDNTLTIDFPNLEVGTYAFSTFHDLNDNGILDLDNLLNLIPQEPFGFSKNPDIAFSSPSFGECSFEVGATDSVVVEIELMSL